MIRTWLDLPAGGIFITLFLLYFGTAALLTLLVFRSPLTRPIQNLSGIVAPFFSSIAVLFALLTGFLAGDIGDRSRQASRSLQAEASELRNVYTLSVASVSDMSNIRRALKTYVDSVISDEWPAMSLDGHSAKTDAAYDALLQQVSDPAIARVSGNAVHAALMAAAVRAGTARSERLSLSADHTNDIKWIVVLLLGLFTQVAIASVHLDKPRAFMAALTIFSTAVVVALGFIALQEYPFYGTLALKPDAFAALQELPETPTAPLPGR